jgi:hypothetical protein
MLSLTSAVYTAAGVLVRHSVYSCSRHGAVTVRLTSERPDNIIPAPKTFTLLAVRCLSQCDAASLYLFALIYCVVCLNVLTLHFASSLKEPEESCE